MPSNNRMRRAAKGFLQGFGNSYAYSYAEKQKRRAAKEAADATSAEKRRTEQLAREKEDRDRYFNELKDWNSKALGDSLDLLTGEERANALSMGPEEGRLYAIQKAQEGTMRRLRDKSASEGEAPSIAEIQNAARASGQGIVAPGGGPGGAWEQDGFMMANPLSGAGPIGDEIMAQGAAIPLDMSSPMNIQAMVERFNNPSTSLKAKSEISAMLSAVAGREPGEEWDPASGSFRYDTDEAARKARAENVPQLTTPWTEVRTDQDFLTKNKETQEARSSLGWLRVIHDANAETEQFGQQGAADYAMVMAFNKIMDPNSVTREGEFDRAVRMGGMTSEYMKLWGQWKAVAKWMVGKDMSKLTFEEKSEMSRMLTPDVRLAMTRMATRAVQSRLEAANEIRSTRKQILQGQFGNQVDNAMLQMYAPLSVNSVVPAKDPYDQSGPFQGSWGPGKWVDPDTKQPAGAEQGGAASLPEGVFEDGGQLYYVDENGAVKLYQGGQ